MNDALRNAIPWRRNHLPNYTIIPKLTRVKLLLASIRLFFLHFVHKMLTSVPLTWLKKPNTPSGPIYKKKLTLDSLSN